MHSCNYFSVKNLVAVYYIVFVAVANLKFPNRDEHATGFVLKL
jgi:hypothetical protein